MLTNFTQNITLTATSTINEEVGLSLRAVINEDGTFNISKNIRNTSLYFANKETCDTDYTEFEGNVCKMAETYYQE